MDLNNVSRKRKITQVSNIDHDAEIGSIYGFDIPYARQMSETLSGKKIIQESYLIFNRYHDNKIIKSIFFILLYYNINSFFWNIILCKILHIYDKIIFEIFNLWYYNLRLINFNQRIISIFTYFAYAKSMIVFLIIVFYILILILKNVIIVSIGEKEVDMYKIIENGEMGKDHSKIQYNNRRCEYT